MTVTPDAAAWETVRVTLNRAYVGTETGPEIEAAAAALDSLKAAYEEMERDRRLAWEVRDAYQAEKEAAEQERDEWKRQYIERDKDITRALNDLEAAEARYEIEFLRAEEAEARIQELEAENARLKNALRRIADAPWKNATVTGDVARRALASDAGTEERE